MTFDGWQWITSTTCMSYYYIHPYHTVHIFCMYWAALLLVSWKSWNLCTAILESVERAARGKPYSKQTCSSWTSWVRHLALSNIIVKTGFSTGCRIVTLFSIQNRERRYIHVFNKWIVEYDRWWWYETRRNKATVKRYSLLMPKHRKYSSIHFRRHTPNILFNIRNRKKKSSNKYSILTENMLQTT